MGTDNVCTWMDESSYLTFCASFAYLAALMFLGVQIRRIAAVRLIFLPASLIAGAIGLCIRLVVDHFDHNYGDGDPCSSKRILNENYMSFWKETPSIAINFVFATLFLGRQLPKGRDIIDIGGPQLVYGQIKAWGNWFWCGLMGLIMVNTFDGLEDIMASMMPVGFEGGHGTAGGLQDLLGKKYYGLAVTSATIGIILGCVGGTALVNWGAWRGHLHYQKLAKAMQRHGGDESSINTDQAEKDMYLQTTDNTGLVNIRKISHGNIMDLMKDESEWDPEAEEPKLEDIEPTVSGFRAVQPLPVQYGDRDAFRQFKRAPLSKRLSEKLKSIPKDIFDYDARPSLGHSTIRSEAMDHLAFQLAHVGLAIFIGYAIKRFLGMIDRIEAMSHIKIFSSFPLFPICMVGGILIELVYKLTGLKNPCDVATMNMISGTSIELLCATAISTISFSATMDEIVAFLLVLLTGTIWQLFCFFYLCRRLTPDCWFERAITEYGMSFGTTSIGLLLLRMADPLRQSTVWEAFSFKQMVHEPFMGGGVWTTFACIFLVNFHSPPHIGIYIVMASGLGAMVIWFTLHFLYFKPRFKPKDYLYRVNSENDTISV